MLKSTQHSNIDTMTHEDRLKLVFLSLQYKREKAEKGGGLQSSRIATPKRDSNLFSSENRTSYQIKLQQEDHARYEKKIF